MSHEHVFHLFWHMTTKIKTLIWKKKLSKQYQ